MLQHTQAFAPELIAWLAGQFGQKEQSFQLDSDGKGTAAASATMPVVWTVSSVRFKNHCPNSILQYIQYHI